MKVHRFSIAHYFFIWVLFLSCAGPMVNHVDSPQLSSVFSDYHNAEAIANRCLPKDSPNHATTSAPYALTVNDSYSKNHTTYARVSACLKRPIREAWATLFTQSTLEWAKVSISEPPSLYPINEFLPPIDYVLKVHYQAGPMIARQHMFVLWRHAILKGTKNEPDEISVQFDKVYGTEHIPKWVGRIGLLKIRESLTAIIMEDALTTKLPPFAPEPQAKEIADGVVDFIHRIQNNAPNWELIN